MAGIDKTGASASDADSAESQMRRKCEMQTGFSASVAESSAAFSEGLNQVCRQRRDRRLAYEAYIEGKRLVERVGDLAAGIPSVDEAAEVEASVLEKADFIRTARGVEEDWGFDQPVIVDKFFC